jgi:hypothetical protein
MKLPRPAPARIRAPQTKPRALAVKTNLRAGGINRIIVTDGKINAKIN